MFFVMYIRHDMFFVAIVATTQQAHRRAVHVAADNAILLERLVFAFACHTN
jgi:hypothetical protein